MTATKDCNSDKVLTVRNLQLFLTALRHFYNNLNFVRNLDCWHFRNIGHLPFKNIFKEYNWNLAMSRAEECHD